MCMEVGYVRINRDARGDQRRALELPDVGAGNQTRVFWKSSMCS